MGPAIAKRVPAPLARDIAKAGPKFASGKVTYCIAPNPGHPGSPPYKLTSPYYIPVSQKIYLQSIKFSGFNFWASTLDTTCITNIYIRYVFVNHVDNPGYNSGSKS